MCLAVGVCAGGIELLRPRGSSGTSQPPLPLLRAQGSTMAVPGWGLSPGLCAGSCHGGHKAGHYFGRGGRHGDPAPLRVPTGQGLVGLPLPSSACASHGAVLGRQQAGTRWLSPLGAIIALQRLGKEVFTSSMEQPQQRPSSR